MSIMNEMYTGHESDDYLQHYGVKGMKWGVIRKRASGGAKNFIVGNKNTSLLHKEGRKNAKADVSSAVSTTSKALKSQTFKNIMLGRKTVLHAEGRKLLKQDLDKAVKAVDKLSKNEYVRSAVAGKRETSLLRTEGRKNARAKLEKVNRKLDEAKPHIKEAAIASVAGRKETSLLRKQGRANAKNQLDSMNDSMKRIAKSDIVHDVLLGKSNPVTERGRANLKSDVDNVQSTLSSVQKSINERLKHDDLEWDEDTIAHYGRKGMKWGQRVFTKGGSQGVGRNSGKKEDVSKINSTELKKRVKRMELEKQYKRLKAEEAAAKAGPLQKGLAKTTQILGNTVENQVKSATNKVVSKYVNEALAKALEDKD